MRTVSKRRAPWDDPRFLGALLGGLVIGGLAAMAIYTVLSQRWAESGQASAGSLVVSALGTVGFVVYWVRLGRWLRRNVSEVRGEIGEQ